MAGRPNTKRPKPEKADEVDGKRVKATGRYIEDTGVVPRYDEEKVKQRQEMLSLSKVKYGGWLFLWQTKAFRNSGYLTARLRLTMASIVIVYLVLGLLQEPKGTLGWETSLKHSAGWYTYNDRVLYQFAMFGVWLIVLLTAFFRQQLTKWDNLTGSRAFTGFFWSGQETPLPLSKIAFHIHCLCFLVTTSIHVIAQWHNRYFNASYGLFGWSVAFCTHKDKKVCNVLNDYGHVCVGFVAAVLPLTRDLPRNIFGMKGASIVCEVWAAATLVPSFYYLIYDVKHPNSSRFGNFFGEYLPSYILFSSLVEVGPQIWNKYYTKRRWTKKDGEDRKKEESKKVADRTIVKDLFEPTDFQRCFDFWNAILIGLSTLFYLYQLFGEDKSRYEGRPTTYPNAATPEGKLKIAALKANPYKMKKYFHPAFWGGVALLFLFTVLRPWIKRCWNKKKEE